MALDLAYINDLASSTDPDLLYHLNAIIRAVRWKLWYNPETRELITDREFGRRERLGLIEGYSINPDHPIFGDPELYEIDLGRRLVSLAARLREVATDLALQIEQVDDISSELVPLFKELSSEFNVALCTLSSDLGEICGTRGLWEDLWEATYPRMKIPAVYDLESLWLGLRSRSHAKVVSEFSSPTVGRALRLAVSFGLIEGDIVELRSEDARSYFIIQDELGMRSLEFAEGSLPPEAERIRSIKGAGYWL